MCIVVLGTRSLKVRANPCAQGDVFVGDLVFIAAAPEKSDVLVPGGDGNLEESVNLLNIFFDFMTTLHSSTRFAYWYGPFLLRIGDSHVSLLLPPHLKV